VSGSGLIPRCPPAFLESYEAGLAQDLCEQCGEEPATDVDELCDRCGDFTEGESEYLADHLS
jgi:hypothetical protein